jgi:hypothetical protein
MRKLIRHVLPIAIAVAIGPLIAGIAVSVFAIALNAFSETRQPFLDILQMSKVYIIVAYFLGGAIAFLAGLLVSVWMVWRQPNFLVAIAAAIIATCIYVAVGTSGYLGAVEQPNARGDFLFILAFAVFAAAGCWFLMRPFLSRLRRHLGSA